MDNTYIDVSKMPQSAIDVLADATLDLLKSILSMPGGREALDAEIAEMDARMASRREARKEAK